MARIPRTEPMVGFRSAEMPASTGSGYEAPGRAMQQVGQGIQNFGQGLGQLGIGLDARQEKDDLFRTNLATLNFENDLDRSELEYRQNYAGDGSNYTADRMQSFEERANQLRSSIPQTPKAQQAAELHLARKRGSFQESALRFEGERRQQDLYYKTDAAITGEIAKLDLAKPEEFESALEGTLNGVDALLGAMPGTPESAKDRIRTATAQLAIAKLKERLPPDKVYPAVQAFVQKWTPAASANASANAPGPLNVQSVQGIDRIVGRPRTDPIKGVVLHQTWGADTIEGNAQWSNRTGTGAQYYIGKDGAVYQWAPDNVVMGHAGKGRGSIGDARPDLTNANTIGIEIMTKANERPNAIQIAAAKQLTIALSKKYGFSTKDVFGHGELAPGHRMADEAIEAVRAIRSEPVSSAEISTTDLRSRAITAGMAPMPKVGSERITGRPDTSVALPERDPGSVGGVNGTPVAMPEPDIGKMATSPAAAIRPTVTAYSPQRAGDAMQGGYGSKWKGPDGKFEVRTLADYVAGRSKYITIAGDKSEEGKSYTIPKIEWIDKDGNRQVTENVKAVVHDTGGAFKGKGNSRFDIAVDKDLPPALLNKQPFSRQQLEFRADDGKAPVQVADASGRIGGDAGAAPPAAPSGTSTEGRIPGNDNARVAGSVTQLPSLIRPSVRGQMVEALTKQMPVLAHQHEQVIGKMIGGIEDAAEKVYALPQQDLDRIRQAVESTNSPALMTRFNMAMGNLTEALRLYDQRPEDIARVGQELRARMVGPDGIPRGTPEQIARVETIEKMAKHVDAELTKNPYAFASARGLMPKVSVLDPAMQPDQLRASLQDRLTASKALQQKYGRPIPIFQPEEVAAFTETMKRGGPQMITTLGAIADQLGPDAPRAFDQIAAEGQTGQVLAQVGGLISIGGSRQAIDDAAASLAMRSKEKETDGKTKLIGPNTSDAMQVAMRTLGGAYMARRDEFDRAVQLALVIYDKRAFDTKQDPKVFNPTLFEDALRESSGQSVDPRTKAAYGGVEKPGMFWGGPKYDTAIPHWLKNGYFSTVIGDLVKPEDILPPRDQARTVRDTALPKAGVPAGAPAEGMPDKMPVPEAMQFKGPVPGVPVTADGKPLSMQQFRSATFVAVGPGKYALAIKPLTDPEPWVMDVGSKDGRYIFDLNKMRDVIAQRAMQAGYKDLVKPE